MQISLAFIFSFVSLAFGVGSGVFFFLLWREGRYQSNFLLGAAAGTFLLYLFQVPFVLANGGVHFVQTNFNIYFLLAFLANFFALVFVYFGLASVLNTIKTARLAAVLGAWYLFAGLGIASGIFAPMEVVKDRPVLFVAALLFFIPLRIAIITILSVTWTKEFFLKRRAFFIGALLVQASLFINLINYIFSLRKILFYPKNFWFIAIVDDKTLLFLGMSASVFLVCGLYKIFQSTSIDPA